MDAIIERWNAHWRYLRIVCSALDPKFSAYEKIKRVCGHAGLVLILELRLLFRFWNRPHHLAQPVILSFTSYPPRFPTLHLTVQCLLTQSIKADEVVLWIAREDEAALPTAVKGFEKYGLKLRYCDNLRSYKKIIPALQSYGHDVYHLICDDDHYLTRKWLSLLLTDTPGPNTILCHTSYRITLDAGHIRPYAHWIKNFDPIESSMLVAFGIGGVLYPPKSLHTLSTDVALLSRLCPDQDDLWLYWMARMNGSNSKQIRRPLKLRSWIGSQTISLWYANNPIGGGNDQAVAKLLQHFGMPFNSDSQTTALAGCDSLPSRCR